jgi:hypothetical protein
MSEFETTTATAQNLSPLALYHQQHQTEGEKDEFADIDKKLSFGERYRLIFNAVSGFSYLSNFVVIVVCFMKLYEIFTSFLEPIIGELATMLSGSISIVILVLGESFKRKFANSYFKERLFKKRDDYPTLFAFVFLLIISLLLSQGGHTISQQFGGEAKKHVAELVNVEDIKKDFDTQIKEAQKNVDKFFSARSWQGKLDAGDAAQYKKLTNAVASLRAERQQAIKEAENGNKTAKAEAESKTSEAEMQHKEKLQKQGTTLTYVSIFFDIALFFCFYYIMYYKINVYLEKKAKTASN